MTLLALITIIVVISLFTFAGAQEFSTFSKRVDKLKEELTSCRDEVLLYYLNKEYDKLREQVTRTYHEEKLRSVNKILREKNLQFKTKVKDNI